MAIAKELWSKIQSYYETWKNPSEIVRLMDEVHVKVDRTSIVKRAKKEEWIRGELQAYPDFDIDEHFASIQEKSQDSQDVKSLRLILAIKEQETAKELHKYNSIQALIHAKPFQAARVDKHLDGKKGLREKSALDTIEQLLGIKLIRQFQVGGFRIDGYDANNKIAYEIDEEQHNTKKHSQADILRQKFIEEQLQCKFVRIKV